MSREAMKMALEVLESDPISHAGLVSRKQAINALRQALETEPEALRLADTLDDEFLQGRISNHNGRKAAVELRRLALKQWVGLTDEELKPLCDENHIMFGAYTVDFIQAIEAKLKEKNGGEYRNGATTERTKLNQENI